MMKKMASLLALVLSLSMAAVFPVQAAEAGSQAAEQESLVVEPEAAHAGNPFTGTWEVQSATMNSSVIPVEQLLQADSLTAEVAENGSVTLRFGNGFTASVMPVYIGSSMVVQYKELGNDMTWIVTQNGDDSATAVYDVYSIALKLMSGDEQEAEPVAAVAESEPEAGQEALVVEPEAEHEGNPFAGVWKVNSATMNSSEIPVSQILQADGMVAVVSEDGTVTLLFSNDFTAVVKPAYTNDVMTVHYKESGADMTWNVVLNQDGNAIALYDEYSIRLNKVQ